MPQILRVDANGCKVWIVYRLDKDRTHPWWLEYVTPTGQMRIRSRHRTQKEANDAYYYHEDCAR